MNDKEDIIAEFEWCIASFSPADTNDEYFKRVCQRVLELLKEQESLMQEKCEEAFHDGYNQAMNEAQPCRSCQEFSCDGCRFAGGEM